MNTRRYFLIAVERSGETLGLDILRRCQDAGVSGNWEGVVGDRLQAAGVKGIAHGEVLAVMGLVEVLRHLGALRQLFAQIRAHWQLHRPDAVVLVDHPAFNLRVAREAKRLGIPVLYVVGPQIWAWRRGRIHSIGQRVDQMLVLFPFERALYTAANIPVQVLPHPLLGQTAAAPSTEAARAALSLPTQGKILALMPGSRRGEITRLARPMIEAAAQLQQEHTDLHLVLILAHADLAALWRQHTQGLGMSMSVIVGRSVEALAAADLVLVASGTATLETALMGKPAVVLYRMQALTFAIARRLVRVPFVALPNLLLGQAVYPELLQDQVQPQQIYGAMKPLLGIAGDIQRRALQPLRALLAGDDDATLAAALRRVLTAGPADA